MLQSQWHKRRYVRRSMPPRRPPTIDPARTAFVVLEYCGGARTDSLVKALSVTNRHSGIHVLDNSSPTNQARSITHRNKANSYVGGGLRDCLALAESLGARYLFYCVNDVTLLDPLVIADFQVVMDDDSDVVVVSCALTADSDQASPFPWMVRQGRSSLRRVRFVDPICCLIRLDFVREFGGFPESKGGWGYSSEMAYHAKRKHKKLLVNDSCAVRHTNSRATLTTADGETVSKREEAAAVYRARYGGIETIRTALDPPAFDETLDLRTVRRKKA